MLKEVETGEETRIALDSALLERYRKRMRHFLENINDLCRKSEIDYYLSDTTIPFDDMLLDYFIKGTRFH